MTANFKKRMLSDYKAGSETTTEIENGSADSLPLQPTAKRLRLTARAVHIDTQNISNAVEAREAVIDLRQQLQDVAENRTIATSATELLEVMEKIRGLFFQFRDTELRCILLQTIGDLLSLPLGSVILKHAQAFLLQTLNEISSVSLRAVLLRSLLRAGSSHEKDRTFCSQITAIIDRSIQYLQSTNKSLLVAGCLDVLGETVVFRSRTHRYVVELWKRFESDASSEVRVAAYQMLRNIGERGFSLDFTMYKKLCYGLEDQSITVRSCAMDLIFKLGQEKPTTQVPKAQNVNSGETINLVDDVFCRICDRVNDWEIEIRAKAATILGQMDGVTIEYINQTVDKKLMSDLRIKVAGHERQKQLYESGEWSSGRKWADDAPKERLQQEDVKLMSIGATGAFVLALEDQFQEVRAPAVISMAQLAAKNPSFGSVCAEFLVDMFNDEIHDVRLNAIRIFPLLGQGVELREDQLEMVLTVLQDANLDIREGLRQILPTLRYSSPKLVRMVFNELLANLKQYPSDHGYICSCLASLGFKNSQSVAEETPSYLNIHPYLHSTEPKSDDKVYIATMALVCNAAANSPEILKIFLDFHLRHYFLYHYKYPDWFPTLETIDQKLASVRKGKAKPHNGITARLVAFRRNCCSGKSLDLVVKALTVLSKEIMMVFEQDVTLDVTTSWLKLQFRFIQKYLSLLKSYTVTKSKQGVDKNDGSFEDLQSVIDEMNTMFALSSSEDSRTLDEFAVREKLLRTLIFGQRAGDLVDLAPVLVEDIGTLVKANAASVFGVLLEQKRIPEQILLQILRSSIPVPQIGSVTLKQIRAEIKLPVENEEYPVNIVAGTIHRIPFEALVEGVTTMDGIIICLLMPDDRRLLLSLTNKDYSHHNERFIIKRDIAVSLSVWTGSAALKVQLCKVIPGRALNITGNYQLVAPEDLQSVVTVGKSVSYFLTPIPVKNNA